MTHVGTAAGTKNPEQVFRVEKLLKRFIGGPIEFVIIILNFYSVAKCKAAF